MLNSIFQVGNAERRGDRKAELQNVSVFMCESV